MAEFNIAARRRARRLVLQALYQWQFTHNDLKKIQQQSYAETKMEKVDKAYFDELLFAIPNQLDEIDANFIPFLDREVQQLNPIELTVLRIATYELTYRLDIPYKVVLNEALELNKAFGTEQGYRYINGVLDKVAHQLRNNLPNE